MNRNAASAPACLACRRVDGSHRQQHADGQARKRRSASNARIIAYEGSDSALGSVQ
jgi:hypothetical protein